MALFGDNDVTLTIKAKDDASAGINSVIGTVGKMAGAFAIGTVAVGAMRSAFGILENELISTVKSFKESEAVAAQTDAVLKSTGHAAGLTAQAVSELASAFEAQTTFGDEAIQSAENLLLTFTNIGKDVFPTATQTVLDMSQALGQDLKSSAIQLGKALQDPIQGVNALQRVGVNFTQSQQDVITKLVDTGKGLEAQKLILAELNKEFGGSAVAAAQTYGGQLEQMKNKLDNFKEVVGKGILEGFVKGLDEGTKNSKLFGDMIGNAASISDVLRDVIYKLTKGVIEFLDWIYKMTGYVKDYVIPTFEILAGGIIAVFGAMKTAAAYDGLVIALRAITSGAGFAATAMFGLGSMIDIVKIKMLQFLAIPGLALGAVAAVATGAGILITNSAKKLGDIYDQQAVAAKEGGDKMVTLVKTSHAKLEDAKKTHNEKVIAFAQAQYDKVTALVQAGNG
jgi:hypothetical protein